MTLIESVQSLTATLSATSDTARLDAELLVAHACQQSRSYLYTYPQQVLTEQQTQQLNLTSKRREQGEPLAYILGQQEFWSLTLHVTPATLIPRPETEHLVEWILAHYPAHRTTRLADLGTGCGAIALAIASERPHWHIDACDQSAAALEIAAANADRLKLQINFHQGYWCDALPRHDYDVVVSNPPYLSSHDPHLLKLSYEPLSALIAGNDGLDAIKIIAQQASQYLIAGGCLLVEHGYDQAPSVCAIVKQSGFNAITSHTDLAGLARYVTACI